MLRGSIIACNKNNTKAVVTASSVRHDRKVLQHPAAMARPTRPRALLTIMFMADLTSAVGFSGFGDHGCRGDTTQHSHGLEPLQCFATTEIMASIQATGLSNTNHPDGSTLTLFRDLRCTEYVTTVKHSGYCINSVFRSLIYMPEVEINALLNVSTVVFEADQQSVANGQQEEVELDLILQKLEEQFERDLTNTGRHVTT